MASKIKTRSSMSYSCIQETKPTYPISQETKFEGIHPPSLTMYPIIQGKKTVGTLSPHYENWRGKMRLTSFWDQDKKVIDIAQVWLNDCPLVDLKGFDTVTLPPKGFSRKKGSQNYYLNLSNRWGCFSKDKKEKIKSLSIKCLYKDKKFSINVPPFIRVSGVRKCIEEKIGKLGGDDKYLLYQDCLPLQDEITVEKCALEKTVVMAESDVRKNYSPHQMSTGGISSSVNGFDTLHRELTEKRDIVCYVQENSQQRGGTAFLIAPHLIMTNAHVLEGKTFPQAQAIFFYDEQSTEKLEIEIDETPVCFSPAPDAIERPSAQKLDYAILRLKPPKSGYWMSESQMRLWSRFEKLGQISEKFFKEARKKYERMKHASAKNDFNDFSRAVKSGKYKLERANIIQHPTEKGEVQPKRFAFRENKVHLRDSFLIHYTTETTEGSSGSPVLTDKGELIGLHYSKCIEVDKKLYKHRLALFKHLGFTRQQTDRIKECYQGQDQSQLSLFNTGDNRGLCYWSACKGGNLTLSAFIIKWLKANSPKIPSKDFISDFLKAQKDADSAEEHHYCNTAININRIFDDLNKDKKANWGELRKAKNIARHEWKVFTRELCLWKPVAWCRTHWKPIVASITSLAGAFWLGTRMARDRRLERADIETTVARAYNSLPPNITKEQLMLAIFSLYDRGHRILWDLGSSFPFYRNL